MKHLLLIITGSVAAYKILEFIRAARKSGIVVTPVMTEGAKQFITPLSVASLSGSKVYDRLFDLTNEVEMGHIQLSRVADAILVAPATANIMAKAAQGLADDLASTLLLAANKPVIFVPAMNPEMWQHPATLRNVAQLRADGAHVMEPAAGVMACGEEGMGRFPEIPAIWDYVMEVVAAEGKASTNIDRMNNATLPLAGKKAIVTSGATAEPIDPVRVLTNHSSGKQGHAIAIALAEAGADVTLIRGNATIADPHHSRIHVVKVQTALEMQQAVESALPADIAICAAAVGDWKLAKPHRQKLKKSDSKEGTTLHLELEQTVDILAMLGTLPAKKRPFLVVGFAAETQDLLAYAAKKRQKKGADWMIANDVSGSEIGFGSDFNKVAFLGQNHSEEWPLYSKQEVAVHLVKKVVDYLAGKVGEDTNKAPRLRAVT